MRKGLIISLLFLLCNSGLVIGQTPLGMNYQGIARSADGSPIINQFIGLRVSITSGPDGSIDFTEEHHPETNEFGLFAVVVGQGQTSGRIADVDWGIGNKWLQIEIDPSDNGNYVLVGSQQLMSVPYALFAAKSGDAIKSGVGIDVANGKVNNTLPDQIVNLNGTGGVTITGTYPNFTIDAAASTNDADADPTNEIQTLSKSGNSISLSNGGGSFVDETDDADANPANELLQSASLAGSNLELTDAGGTKTVDLSSLVDGTGTDNQTLTNTILTSDTRELAISGGNNITLDVSDNDNNSTNELQTLSKTGSTVSLTSGGGSFIDAVNDADASPSNELQSINKTGSTVTLSNGGGSFTDAVNDADANPSNELQSISKSGTTVSLSNGGGSFNDAVNDADANPSNELQSISKAGSTVTLSNGGGSFTDSVNDADSNPTNEIQTLSKSGDDLSLTGGGIVDLSSYMDNTDNQNLSSTAAGTNRTINISDGSATTISVADNDNSTSNELITSGSYIGNNTVRIVENGVNTDVPVGTLNANLNANSNRITNVANPVAGGDAVNLSYLEAKDATDYAFKSIISSTGTGSPLTFDLSTFDFDEGSLITVSQITISETGVYMFNIKGTATNNAPIVVNVNNSTDYVVGLINLGKYSDTVLLKLTAGDVIELRANSSSGGEVFTLEFFGFKI